MNIVSKIIKPKQEGKTVRFSPLDLFSLEPNRHVLCDKFY